MKRAWRLLMLSLTLYVLVTRLDAPRVAVDDPLPGPWTERGALVARVFPPSTSQIGVASWYGKKFQGRLTASGERYDMHQPTAAHRTAPLGSHAVVTNLANGRAVRVRINDRGPQIPDRILDLSYEAARRLDMVRVGAMRVKVEFLEAVPRLAYFSHALALFPAFRWEQTTLADREADQRAVTGS